MRVAEFDFELPVERIAQRPPARRDDSRLLVLDRESGRTAHRRFRDLPELLRRGDLLVLNDTRVAPARLIARKPSGGRVELLLVERLEAGERCGVWRCLLKASRKPRAGSRLELPGGLRAVVLARDRADWHVRLECDDGSLGERLSRVGRAPLPPYIRREDDDDPGADRERYQTVFAEHHGAIAAPTAGLHFSAELLRQLQRSAVEVARITLHVGLGTFQPVAVERVEDHRMHDERYELPPATARAVAAARRRGGRVVAVGTTVVRTLEACADDAGGVAPGSGLCGLFIYPGYRFRVVDALITNFHLPRSTLLMLVSAFAGRERILAAYREAVAADYRFYSFGDAMWIGAAP